MGAQVVEDDDLPWAQCRHEEVFDIGFKCQAVGRTWEDHGWAQTIERERSDQGGIGWRITWNVADCPLSTRCASIARRKVEVAATLINDDDVVRSDGR